MKFRMRITGTTPLLMHNGRLSNPIDPVVLDIKKFTSKRKKTEEDHLAIAQLEHAGGMYLDPDVGPYIPGDNIHATLVSGGKKHKLGKRVTESVLITSDINPIAYKGPRDAKGLWKDKNFVHMNSAKVGQARVMRCRPIFREWATEIEGILDDSVMDESELRLVAETAGTLCGTGDWRPKHGRFTSELVFGG